MRLAEHVTCVGKGEVQTIFVEILGVGTRLRGRPRLKWERKIRMVLGK